MRKKMGGEDERDCLGVRRENFASLPASSFAEEWKVRPVDAHPPTVIA